MASHWESNQERQSERRADKREMKPLFAFFIFDPLCIVAIDKTKPKWIGAGAKMAMTIACIGFRFCYLFKLKLYGVCVCVRATKSKRPRMAQQTHPHKIDKAKSTKISICLWLLDLIFAGCHTPLCACPFCVLLFELSFFVWFLFFICLTLMTTKTTQALHEMHTVLASQWKRWKLIYHKLMPLLSTIQTACGG